jgi:hypothetical protein
VRTFFRDETLVDNDLAARWHGEITLFAGNVTMPSKVLTRCPASMKEEIEKGTIARTGQAYATGARRGDQIDIMANGTVDR